MKEEEEVVAVAVDVGIVEVSELTEMDRRRNQNPRSPQRLVASGFLLDFWAAKDTKVLIFSLLTLQHPW